MTEHASSKIGLRVETSRTLIGTLENLLGTYSVGSPIFIRHQDIINTLKSDRGGELSICSPDGMGELYFTSRELLFRFSLLKIPAQKVLITAIRNAMQKNSVMHCRLALSLSSKHIEIQQLSREGDSKIFGEGPLLFSW
jgi:hypothetical protein